jgi:hypothetical protein
MKWLRSANEGVSQMAPYSLCSALQFTSPHKALVVHYVGNWMLFAAFAVLVLYVYCLRLAD